MKTKFKCYGSVRGECGHLHRTIEGAVKCKKRDNSGCKSQGGYSDRNIVAVENNINRPLNEQEFIYSIYLIENK